MPTCVIKLCKNYTGKTNKSQGITFHTFPKTQNRKDEWIRIIRKYRGQDNWNPSSCSTVCSAHFDDDEIVTTRKGLRRLVPYAVPKMVPPYIKEADDNQQQPILSFLETNTQNTTPCILQEPPYIKEEADDNQQQLILIDSETNTQNTTPSILQVLEYCRFCATSKFTSELVNVQCDQILKELVVNMLNRLNTNIEFGEECLPRTICSECIKSLYTAYDFVVGIDQAQMTLNKRLQVSSNIGATVYNFGQTSSTSNMTNPIKLLSSNSETAVSNLEQPLQISSTYPYLKDSLNKKQKVINSQKNKIKLLNQKFRRLRNRYESLQNILKNLKERYFIGSDIRNPFNGNIVAADLVNNLKRTKKKNFKYSQALKDFCLTLKHYSPRAYDYVRISFDNCLPHRKTLARWHGHSQGDPDPGDREESGDPDLGDTEDSDDPDTSDTEESGDTEELFQALNETAEKSTDSLEREPRLLL